MKNFAAISRSPAVYLTLAVSALTASQAYAYDFSSADAAFAKREDSAQLAAATKLYNASLDSVSGAEKVYASEQLARLAFYEGNSIPESDSSNRKKVFKRCMDVADTFDTKTVQHSYWRSLCLASWAKANGVLKSLEKAGEILELVEAGRKADETYEGGGIYRVGSAVYLNLPPLFGGDIDKAWSYAQRAIASPAYAGSKNPDTDTGNYFYGVYLYAGQIAAKREGKDAAKAIVTEAIERIEGGDMPVDRVPETNQYLVELKAYLATLN